MLHFSVLFFSVFIDSSASTSFFFVLFIQKEEIGADNPPLKTIKDDPHTYKYRSNILEGRGFHSLKILQMDLTNQNVPICCRCGRKRKPY